MMEETIILYIDDDPDDLLIFGESIGKMYPGITVLKAQSADEGMGILTRLEQELSRTEDREFRESLRRSADRLEAIRHRLSVLETPAYAE